MKGNKKLPITVFDIAMFIIKWRFHEEIIEAHLSQQADFNIGVWYGEDGVFAKRLRCEIDSQLQKSFQFKGAAFFEVVCEEVRIKPTKGFAIYLKRNKPKEKKA